MTAWAFLFSIWIFYVSAYPVFAVDRLPNCPEGFELKRDGKKLGCYPTGYRGPVSFKVADDAQLESLRNFDIKSEFKGVNVFPTQKGEQVNYRGWIQATNLTEQPLVKIPKGMKELPAPYTFFGKDKCHFSRFLNSPSSVVQPGDMLIYFFPDTKMESSSLYRNIVHGMVHTGLVTKDYEGNLMRLESPFSGRGFEHRSYHLLRLQPTKKKFGT